MHFELAAVLRRWMGRGPYWKHKNGGAACQGEIVLQALRSFANWVKGSLFPCWKWFSCEGTPASVLVVFGVGILPTPHSIFLYFLISHALSPCELNCGSQKLLRVDAGLRLETSLDEKWRWLKENPKTWTQKQSRMIIFLLGSLQYHHKSHLGWMQVQLCS